MGIVDYDKLIMSLLKNKGIGVDVRNALAEQGLEVKGEEIVKKTTEPKFNVGDWLVSISFGDVVQIERFDEENNNVWFTDGTGTDYEALYDYEHWTIDDANDGDVLATENFIFIFKNIDDYNGVHYYCQYEISKHEDDNQFDIALPQSLMGRVGNGISHYSPATKEQRDLLFQKMKEAGYVWDENEKTLKKAKADEMWWTPLEGDVIKKKNTDKPLLHLVSKKNDYTFSFVEERENGIAGGEIRISDLMDKYELVRRPVMKTPEESLDIKTEQEAEAYKNAINDCLFGDEIKCSEFEEKLIQMFLNRYPCELNEKDLKYYKDASEVLINIARKQIASEIDVDELTEEVKEEVVKRVNKYEDSRFTALTMGYFRRGVEACLEKIKPINKN